MYGAMYAWIGYIFVKDGNPLDSRQNWITWGFTVNEEKEGADMCYDGVSNEIFLK